MASLVKDRASGNFRVRFRYLGVSFNRSLKTSDSRDAAAAFERIDETLRLIERGRLEIPHEAAPAIFILSDGKRSAKAALPKALTLDEMFKAYLIFRTGFR